MDLIELDKALFLGLNGLHTPWLDPIMFYATKNLFWMPMYLFFVYHIIQSKRWEALYVLLGIVLVISMADQVTSSLMKPLFARLRPSHNPFLQETVHIVNGYRGGLYGFPSSHAANSFALALILYRLYRKEQPHIGWVFLWAFIFSYTRIYLGVHYPADIVIGAVIGLLSGMVTLWLLYRVRPGLFHP